MHIRLFAFGTRGDVQPFVALGLGLHQAGVEVSLVCHFSGSCANHGTLECRLLFLISSSGQGIMQRNAKVSWRLKAYCLLFMQAKKLSQGRDLQ